MIYDRPYMREPGDRRQLSVLGWIIVLTVGVFLAQAILEVWFKQPALPFEWLALSLDAVRSWHFWTVFTYGWLHGQVGQMGILHVGFNMLALWLLGREVAPVLGGRRFGWFYVGSIVASGLFWLAVAWPAQLWLSSQESGSTNIQVVGASGAVSAVLALWACVAVDQPRTFLLFFIIPVSLRPRHFAWGMLAISLFGMLFLEIPGVEPVAHSSHLGGLIAGWLYYKLLYQHRLAGGDDSEPSIELPHWMRKRRGRGQTASGNFKVNVAPPAQDIRAEVDRILDKINSVGFGSLTDDERRVLDEARDLLNRR